MKHTYKPGAPITGNYKGHVLHYAVIKQRVAPKIYKVKHASFKEPFEFDTHLVLYTEITGLSKQGLAAQKKFWKK